VVTLGDHAFDQRDTLTFIEREPTLVRPLNMAHGTPGRGATLIEGRNGHRVLVVNAQGRVFMDPIDDPFRAVETAVAACPLGEQADAIVVDFHTEATSEIQGMGFFLDGRVSLVVGTHTHIPTSDHRILRGGTALMADAGMCGDYDSIIGVEADEPLNRFLTGIAQNRFTPAEGAATLCGVAVETDARTGLAGRLSPVRIGGVLAQALPDFS
jgi:2',3'-cyclic-nucleotide 2'-phosphodiesterase